MVKFQITFVSGPGGQVTCVGGNNANYKNATIILLIAVIFLEHIFHRFLNLMH